MSRAITLLLAVGVSLFGLSIAGSYDAAHKQALQEGKILVVLLAKKGHAPSNRALMRIMQDKKSSELLQKQAVFAIVFEGDKQSYPIEMLYSDTVPTLFFLDERELFVCKALRGEIDPAKIRSCLTSIKK